MVVNTSAAPSLSHLRAVVFDWAGTTVDCGCCGPVEAFVRSFAAFGVDTTTAEARAPMGLGKWEHVAAMCAMPRIAALWEKQHGAAPVNADIDKIYAHVEANMLDVVVAYSQPIPGTVEAVAEMRAQGLRIGSCTGYPRSVAEKMAVIAAAAGYAPDCLVAATDVEHSRPAPDMCYRILASFGITEPWRAVKIGDTTPDILEGKRAGMWTIGISLTSSLVGLSAEGLGGLSSQQRSLAAFSAEQQLVDAGADFVVEDIRSCPAVLAAIDKLCSQGQRPHV